MDLTGGSSWLDLVQGGPGAFSFAQDAEQAVASLGLIFPHGDYHSSRNLLERVAWGADNQLNGSMGAVQAQHMPASAGTPPQGAWQQQLYSSSAAAEAPPAAGLDMPQYGLNQELLLFQQHQQLLLASSQPPPAGVLQQAHEPRPGLSMGMPIQQQQHPQLQPQLFPQQQQQQQQQFQPQMQPLPQHRQQFQQLPQMQQMQPHQVLQQQQHQFQLPSSLPHHAVTTCGPGALGTAALPAFSCMAPAEQVVQSSQQVLSMPMADVCFSSVGSAAAAAGASAADAAGPAVDKGRKPRGSSGKRGTQVSAATGKPLTKSGDASRRYRERQRGLMATLEAELEGKLGQLQLLAAENEMLKLRASVLESTVASREYVVQVTQEHGPPVYDSASSLLSSEDPHHEPCEGTDSGPLPQPGLQAAAAEPAPPARRCMSLQELHDLAAPVPEVAAAAAATAAPTNSVDSSSDTTAAGSGIAGHCSSGSAARAGAESPTARSKSCPELIKEMSVEDIVQHYRLFVRELSDELVAVQQEKADAAYAAGHAAAAGSSAAAASWPGVAAAVVKPEDSSGFSSLSEQRLQQLTERCRYMFRTAAALNPAAYCQLFDRNLETGQPVAYDDKHWRQVIGRLGLSETQVRHVAACAELYFPALHQLQAERATLQQQLQASGPAHGMLINCDGFSPMQPVLDALATNLKKEHVMRVMLTGFVFGGVFSSLQKAKVIIFSAPVFPDMHAITCVVVKDALAKRAAQGLPPRFVFPHRHGPGSAKRLMEGAAAGLAMLHQQQVA